MFILKIMKKEFNQFSKSLALSLMSIGLMSVHQLKNTTEQAENLQSIEMFITNKKMLAGTVTRIVVYWCCARTILKKRYKLQNLDKQVI